MASTGPYNMYDDKTKNLIDEMNERVDEKLAQMKK